MTSIGTSNLVLYPNMVLLRHGHREKQKEKELQKDEEQKRETRPDTEAEVHHAAIVEPVTAICDPAPKDICTDFVADELAKIVEQLSHMKGDMTEEEHADAMASLVLLRDEAR